MLKYLHKINLSGGVILLALLLICSVSASAETKTYEKVTSALTDYSGEYLIVYENGKVALDGSLESIDAVNNNTSVTIGTDKTISIDNKYSVTISKSTTNGSYYIKTASGYYIGRTTTSNGLDANKTTTYDNTINISADGTAIITSSKTTLKYNNASNQSRFRYYKSGQESVCLYKLKEATNPNTPSISVDYGSIDLGTCNINEPSTIQVTVTGANLSEKIAISMEGDNVFSVDKEELEATGGKIIITYAPTKEGSNTAKFTLTSGETTATIEITAKARDLSTVGNGTEEMPFTLEYVNELNNSKSGNYWVKGTIAGFYNNGQINTSGDTNLALQDAGSDIVVPLALTTDFRTTFGVKTNPHHVGRVILVSGSLTSYFSMPGIKDPTDIKFVTDKFNISASKWATYYTDKAFIMPENATGYIVVPSGSDANTVSLEKTYNAGDAVPANTPILINGEAGEYTYYVTTTTATADSRNMLRGQLEAGTITPEENGEYLYYKLSYNSDGNALGFYWGAENGGVFSLTGSNRAYLVVESTGSNAKAVKVNWPGDETTGISDIRTDKTNDNAIYNLAGQRVAKATKGIYIKNGKKFIAK